MQVTALSLSAGIQSTTLALMLEEGFLSDPKPDVAVFADTQAEPPHVYQTLDYLEGRVSFPLLRPSLGDLEEATFRQARDGSYLDIPAFGSAGIGKRQCTRNYKVHTVRRAVRQWAQANPPKLQVTQYLGISLDEVARVRDSGAAYVTNRYPLITARLTRQHCRQWLTQHHPEAPVGKSACYFCPFHGLEQWRELRRRYPDLYARAVELDDTLRNQGLSLVRPDLQGEHHGLEALLASSDLQGRLDFGDGFTNECEGVCDV